MRKLMLVVCLALPLAVGAAPDAHAQSGKLWLERASGAPPLAQVPDFAKLARDVVPAVVSIQVEQKVKMSRGVPGGPGRDPRDPFFWFTPEGPREFKNRGIGSGFVIRPEGLILTNNHVVEGAETIEVTFQNPNGSERKLTARVLGTAPEYDIALIQTEEDAKATATYLGDSDAMNIGDWVMAVGNPFGLTHSVSVGIISAKERREIAPSGRSGLYDFIQTDASINPGNSGGPLINMRGEVIGINTAINAQGAGIGFAIPINMVKNMLPDLRAKGRYSRSWIGIKIQPLSPELAQSYGLSNTQGALVAEVVPSSPASQAGIKEGDVILLFDGKELRHSSDLPLFASMAGVGKEVKLKVWRDKKEREMSVRLSEFPQEQVAVEAGEGEEGAKLGLTVHDITPRLVEELDLEVQRGVVVTELDPAGVAARAGLRPGDVILSLNNEEPKNARAFAQAVKNIKSGGILRLKVQREGSRIYLAIKQP